MILHRPILWKGFVMLERPTRGIWKWSLLAACILTGLFYLLNYTGLFPQHFVFISFFADDSLTVTLSMALSEFITDLSRFFSLWNWVTTGEIVIALLLYSATAWWIARRRASMKAGILAGIWAGLFYGLINLIISAVLFLVFNSTSFSSSAGSDTRAYFVATQIILEVSSFLFGFVLYGLLPGIVGGLLGGLFGRFTKTPPETPVAASRQADL
jgi:hypothetical protein